MKNLLIKSIVILIGISAFGQDAKIDSKSKVRFGVYAGANRFTNSSSSNTYGNEEFTADYGYQIGGTINIPMSEHFSFQPELAFQRLGSSIKHSNVFSNGSSVEKTIFVSNYLQIPLNFKYSFSNKINMDFGPNFGFLINSKKIDSFAINYSDGSSFDNEYTTENTGRKVLYGLNLGLNYNLNDYFYINIRDTFFAGEFSKLSDTFRNSVFCLNLGYQFK